MRRGFIRTACSLLLAIGLFGCGLESATYTPQSPAKVRAANEFDCSEDQLVVLDRPDLSDHTVDISGCGHTARYTCVSAYRPAYRRSTTCVREPME
jgi:hypothetical protein